VSIAMYSVTAPTVLVKPEAVIGKLIFSQGSAVWLDSDTVWAFDRLQKFSNAKSESIINFFMIQGDGKYFF
jgi:hypothetical protein